MDFKSIHINSISHCLSKGNIILRYQGHPLAIKTDIVVFDSGVYKDTRGRYFVDLKLSSELHHFLLMLDARLEKIAANYKLKYLRVVKKDSRVITLKVPFNRKFGVKVFKEGKLSSVEDIQFGEGANVVLALDHMWIMNDDISGPLTTVSQIDLALKIDKQETD